jgi:hypothetical protein
MPAKWGVTNLLGSYARGVPLLAGSGARHCLPESVGSSTVRKQCDVSQKFPGKQWHTAQRFRCQENLPDQRKGAQARIRHKSGEDQHCGRLRPDSKHSTGSRWRLPAFETEGVPVSWRGASAAWGSLRRIIALVGNAEEHCLPGTCDGSTVRKECRVKAPCSGKQWRTWGCQGDRRHGEALSTRVARPEHQRKGVVSRPTTPLVAQGVPPKFSKTLLVAWISGGADPQ